MKLFRYFSALLSLTICVYGFDKHTYIGCYKYEGKQDVILNIPSIPVCVEKCGEKNFQFALLHSLNRTCFCSNSLGEKDSQNSTEKCNHYSVYSSGNQIGPPKNFHVVSLKEDGVEISWGSPESGAEVTSYEITANVVHTFSQYVIPNTTWVYSSDTFRTALNLQPASKYNVTICARAGERYGNSSSLIVETLVGVPDNKPRAPEILSRNGTQMTVKIFPAINNNGPISFYQVIVLNELAKTFFQPEYLKSYAEYSLEDNLHYYITAELTPFSNEMNFRIGDKKHYGKYFNAPLFASVEYNLILGIVSTYNNVTRSAYSDASKLYQSVKSFKRSDIRSESDNSITSTLLIVAIIVLSILLIAGIVGFLFLRRHVQLKHRHNRLSEQELTLQGPMINVENSAYLPEEEQMSIDHYKNLKQRLRMLSLGKELSVDAHSIIGKGSFGTICQANLNENNSNNSLAAYCIPDKSLDTNQRKLMLKNLDMLIRCEKHDNLIELVGTSESSHMLYVILKVFPTNLKQFLISNRVITSDKFCQVSESQILGIITQISHGIAELEKNRIYHKHLCAENIMLTGDLVPKIFGFGLADYVTEKELNYTRWTAVEVLKGHDFTSRSPIWSFGVLLWEICALGATPYSNISNSAELIDKISRGTRLPQLKYFSDDLYQIMLGCWQVDMGERPDSEDLCRFIENLHQDMIIPFISFQFYQTFNYEQYKPELEFKNY